MIMELPRYYTVGPRAIKFVAGANGGMSVLKMNSKSGVFEYGMEFFARATSSDSDAERLSEDEFIQYVESVRGRMLQGDGPIQALYGLINAMEDVAEEQGRRLTAEEEESIAEMRRQTYAMFQALHPDEVIG